jgi:AcrR family transcriptional regulator
MHFATLRETPASPAQDIEPGSKRDRTRRRMEKAAVRLALENGIDNVTVDQICAASDVSARTFFNYFGSKEAALVGREKPQPSAEAIERFIAGDGPILNDFMKFIMDAAMSAEPDLELIKDRRALMHDHPELASLVFARNAGARDMYAAIALERIRREMPDASEEDLRDEALVAVGVLMGVVHVVGNRWIESGGTADTDDLVDRALERLTRLI